MDYMKEAGDLQGCSAGAIARALTQAHAAGLVEGEAMTNDCEGCKKVRTALRLAWDLCREDEDANTCFERIASWFYKETGYLRPGKDCRIHSYEERQAVWEPWIKNKWSALSKAIQKALAPEPEKPEVKS